MQGIHLNNQFVGTGFHSNVRMTGDFGSNLYAVEALTKTE